MGGRRGRRPKGLIDWPFEWGSNTFVFKFCLLSSSLFSITSNLYPGRFPQISSRAPPLCGTNLQPVRAALGSGPVGLEGPAASLAGIGMTGKGYWQHDSMAAWQHNGQPRPNPTCFLVPAAWQIRACCQMLRSLWSGQDIVQALGVAHDHHRSQHAGMPGHMSFQGTVTSCCRGRGIDHRALSLFFVRNLMDYGAMGKAAHLEPCTTGPTGDCCYRSLRLGEGTRIIARQGDERRPGTLHVILPSMSFNVDGLYHTVADVTCPRFARAAERFRGLLWVDLDQGGSDSSQGQ